MSVASKTPTRTLLGRAVVALALSGLVVGCSSEDSDGSAEQDTNATKPLPTASCKTPEKGRFFAKLEPRGSCSWWKPEAADGRIVYLGQDEAQFPGVDNRCRSVEWGTCSAKSSCPAMINANGIGYPGTVTLNVAYTDDSHIAGTVTYDAGLSCKVVFDLTADTF